MRLLDDMMNKKAELQIAPLIDVVFLLLIYFMVTSALKDKEADLSFMLPAKVESEQVSEPWEVVIEIGAPLENSATGEPDPRSGDVSLFGQSFGQRGDLEDLITQLKQQAESAKASSSEFVVNILPKNDAMHGRIIQVMDACAAAKAKNVSFSSDPTEDD